MMKKNYHWVLLGIAAGIVIYMVDKYIFLAKIYFMKKLKPKPHQFWAWCSTLTILGGAITAALGFYPLYCYIFLIGNSGLAIVSWLWNEKSLVALNTGLASIYLIGLINLYFN